MIRAALARYEALGLRVRTYDHGQDYGFARRNGVELHLTYQPTSYYSDGAIANVHLRVEDAELFYREWTKPGIGAQAGPPAPMRWGMREGTHTDPDGNVIRFGSAGRTTGLPRPAAERAFDTVTESRPRHCLGSAAAQRIGDPMAHHMSLRAHLVARAERGHTPQFQPSNDPPLVAFAELFATTSWYSFDVTKRVPEDAFGTRYELTSETLTAPDAEPDVVLRQLAPVLPGGDLGTAVRDAPESSFFGISPSATVASDIYQQAFLLLATSNYIHLSASREQTPPLVRGAIAERGEEFRYVVLDEQA